jgi:hypothetical protein
MRPVRPSELGLTELAPRRAFAALVQELREVQNLAKPFFRQCFQDFIEGFLYAHGRSPLGALGVAAPASTIG